MSEELITRGPDIEEGLAKDKFVQLFHAWLKIAIPDLAPDCAQFVVGPDGVELRCQPGIDGSNVASFAAKLAKALDDSVDWEKLEDSWASLRREGAKWGCWKLEKELEPEPLTHEEFADGARFMEVIAPYQEELSKDDWNSLELMLGRPVSAADASRLAAYYIKLEDEGKLASQQEETSDNSDEAKPIYKVKIYDNFHNQDEDSAIIFDYDFVDPAEALECCKWITEKSVVSFGYDIQKYKTFGQDPIIVSPPGAAPAEFFSAWAFAELLCQR